MDNSQGESPVVVTNECVRRILRAKARATLGWGGEDRNWWPPILWEMSCLLPPSAHGLGSSFKGPADEQRGGDEESPELSVPEECSFCQALCLGSTRGRVMRPHLPPHKANLNLAEKRPKGGRAREGRAFRWVRIFEKSSKISRAVLLQGNEKRVSRGLNFKRNVTKNASHSDFNLLIGPFCEGGI